MMNFLRKWRRRRAAEAALVEADAVALIGRFGPTAYDVARERTRDERARRTIDQDRPRGHWTKVKLRVGAMTGRVTGADTATRMVGEGRPPARDAGRSGAGGP